MPPELRGDIVIDDSGSVGNIKLILGGSTVEDRSKFIEQVTQHWRKQQTFHILSTWRNEPWPIYDREGQLCLNVERSAAGLFGVNRYGVHMTAYVKNASSSHGIKIWVPKRAATKSNYPGMLDNTVAGGLMTGEDPFECIIREADEEASLPESVVRTLAKPVGTVSYIHITDKRAGGEAGLIYPEFQWVYDLELPDHVIPVPKDGEAESFTLCDIEAIQHNLALGRFKPNCALVMIDFFIRHGILNRENEVDLDEICRHLRRTLPFPGPRQTPQP